MRISGPVARFITRLAGQLPVLSIPIFECCMHQCCTVEHVRTEDSTVASKSRHVESEKRLTRMRLLGYDVHASARLAQAHEQ